MTSFVPDKWSRSVFADYIDRSWSSNALRQQAKGVEFVIGRREGAYLWNLANTHRVIDCGGGGGVHSLGHRHPAVLSVLQKALSEGRDTGLWSLPNAEYIRLQDMLRVLAPCESLDRSVITLCSTLSIDLAIMFAFRMTKRQQILVYRHGYHGHTGLAALATGSLDEGILDYYNLPRHHSVFFERYGAIEDVIAPLNDAIAAVIVEPINYETFEPAPSGYLEALERQCHMAGALFILDETRTGLGRSGRMWAAEHYDIQPDILITGKGLSGGLYPASAVMTNRKIYDTCINSHKFSYISSLGGNEISCIVAEEVLRQSSAPEFLSNVRHIEARLREHLGGLRLRYNNVLSNTTIFGGMVSLQVGSADMASRLFRAAFDEGVLCHSVSAINPPLLKLLPPLIADECVLDEIVGALARALGRISNEDSQ